MSKSEVCVLVRHYNDQDDPYPPNNYRVEIEIGGYTFIYDPRDNWELRGCMPKKRAEKIAQEVRSTLGIETQPAKINYGVLTPQQRNRIHGKLLRLKGDVYVTDTRGPGDDYCWECGYIAPNEEFVKENKCPNPKCLRPENWND